MRFASVLAFVLGLVGAGGAVAQESYVPERRVAITENVDFYGGDLKAIFDTTFAACRAACLAEPACRAFTFNGRAGSCFPKTDVSERQPYDGAMSAQVFDTAPRVLAAAAERQRELAFLRPADLAAARAAAEDLANRHYVGDFTARDYAGAAARARAAGERANALAFSGAAVVLADAPDLWVSYGEDLLALQGGDYGQTRDRNTRAFAAAVNGYLRAGDPAARASALLTMGKALEVLGRGQDSVPALRLAATLSPREDIVAARDRAIAQFGFRVTEHAVESDAAIPRICADFSEPLAEAGVDYAPFVQIAGSGYAVDATGNRLCIEGVKHGERYRVTFREGLPSAEGETTAKAVTLDLYVRDRAPSVRFPGRAYVLPKAGEAAVPVVTVNADSLDLVLRRVSDRNILRAIQDDYFGRPLAQWQEELFGQGVSEEVWRGTGAVEQVLNEDVTTRLPMVGVMAGLKPGIYALQARVTGENVYETAAATQWFVISDLGLATMSGIDGLHVFVRSLASAEPKQGVTLTLISRANEVLGTAETDAMGYAVFAAGLARSTGGAAPALVTAEEGADDIAFLSLTDPEFDLSDRGVEGREAAPPIDLFLTTERGAYRAGETIFATALARDGEAAAIEGLPLTAILTRPDGVEYSRTLSESSQAGGHVFALPVADWAPRGAWKLAVHADPKAAPLATTTVLVEDFLPERIDFTLALPEGPIRLTDAPLLTLEARYLFGPPAADLAVEGNVQLTAVRALPGFPGYEFGRADAPFEARYAYFESGIRTDDEGRAAIPVSFPEVAAPDRPLQARITATVAEGSGRPVERRIERLLAPASALIGIKPAFEGVVPEGTEARFDVIAVGPDGERAAMPVKWVLNRVETRYQWYQLYGGWEWEPVTTRRRVTSGEAMLTAEGAVSVSAPVEWGNYELRVERADGSFAASSVEFYAGWYAPADASETPDTLAVSLDKPAYRPGETATVRIVPRFAGKGLVTVVSNRLIAMQAVDLAEGENTVRFPVTDDWGSGAYVTATVIRPMDVAAGRNPARALGLAHAAVDPGSKRLDAAFQAPAEAAPRGPLDVALKVDGVAEAETAWATIAAVDVGILNLTAFQSPNPEGHYFGQRKLGMGLRDLYGRLIDGMNGALGEVRSGGDALAEMRMQGQPPTEELVAYFTGPVQVGPDGLAHASFDLPSFNGTVRLMAVAWSRSGVGEAQAEVLVRDPVVVTATVPRFMSPGDETRLLLEIVHATGPSGRVGLDVTAEGLALGAAPSGVDLADQGKAVVSVPVTAGETGVQHLRVALTTPDGKQLLKELTLPVIVTDPEIARQSRFTLAAGDTFTFGTDVFAGLRPGTGTATLSGGPLARFDAPGLLAALDRYPYGCTEQITSAAMPLLYFEDVANALGLAAGATARERVNEAIAEVLANQASNGSFGLWRPEGGDMWLDAYVSDFLSRAKAQGFEVPETAFRSAMDSLRNQVNYYPDFDRGGQDLAYALFVLAREGAAAVGDLRYYADAKGADFATPLAAAQLGAALALYGDQTRADAMFAQAQTLLPSADPDPTLWRADYGTRLRDMAGLLALAVESGSEAVDREALAARIANAGQGRSTQEALWTLLAAHALIERPAVPLSVDGVPVEGPLVRVLEAQAAGAPLAIRNEGTREEALTLTTFGVPSDPEPSGGNGWRIARSYYSMEGEPADPARVAVGTRLVTVLEVTPLGPREARLIVNDPLPAGFEIDNPNLMQSGDIRALDWLGLDTEARHAEFRDERFVAAVDHHGDRPFRLAYIVRAISPGAFHHPAASVEDMYRPEFRARTEAGRVTVTE
jgi:uncharacterized protein YfaS (alpha-2-macroglobulin family)